MPSSKESGAAFRNNYRKQNRQPPTNWIDQDSSMKINPIHVDEAREVNRETIERRY
jgi:hypothetical protein